MCVNGHVYVCQRSCLCVLGVMYMCVRDHVCVIRVMYMCVKGHACVLGVMYMCVRGHVYVCQGSYICVLGVMYMCVRGHVFVCQGSCICVLGVLIFASVYTIFGLNFLTVSTTCYFLFFYKRFLFVICQYLGLYLTHFFNQHIIYFAQLIINNRFYCIIQIKFIHFCLLTF